MSWIPELKGDRLSLIGEVNLEALVTGGIGARSPGGRLVQRGRMIPHIASIKEVNERD